MSICHPEVNESLKVLCCFCVRPAAPGHPLFDNNEFVYRPVWVGPNILFWGKRQSQFPSQCFVGPDWPFVLIFYAVLLFFNLIALNALAKLGIGFVVVGMIGLSLTLWYYSATVGSNPGIMFKEPLGMDEEHQPLHVSSASSALPEPADTSTSNSTSTASPIQTLSPKPDMLLCGSCDLQRPLTARHCHMCEACINDLDHHCPWSGKCIGAENRKNFNCFVGWIGFQIWFIMGSFVYFIIHQSNESDDTASSE